MTLKVVKIINDAEVIAYPVGDMGKSVALSIVEGAFDLRDKQLVGLHFPMTRDETLTIIPASVDDEELPMILDASGKKSS